MESHEDPNVVLGQSSSSHHCNRCLAHYEPASILTQLHIRIAQLETELLHARNQRDTAQTINTYLLETLVKRAEHQGRDNNSSELSSPKPYYTESESTKNTTPLFYNPTTKPTLVPDTLINLIDLTENDSDGNNLHPVLSPSSGEPLSSMHKTSSLDKPVTPTKHTSSTDPASATYLHQQPRSGVACAQSLSTTNDKYASTYRQNYVPYDFKRAEQATTKTTGIGSAENVSLCACLHK